MATNNIQDTIYSLLFWACLLMMIGGITLLYHHRNQPTVLSFDMPPEEVQDTEHEAPVHISIPSLNIQSDIEPGHIVENIWSISEHNINHLHTSARPGSGGNIVLYGHNSKDILGRLPHIQEGATIVLTDDEGETHEYIVYTTYTVTPDTLDPVQPTNEEIVTIYTCTGLFNSQRFITRAKPI